MSYGSKAAQRLQDKVILITGASSGIGEAIAKELAEAAEGKLKFVLTARRKDKLDSLSKELTSKYPSVKVYVGQLDVSQVATIDPFLKSLPKEFAEIDVLVNNAGLALGRDPVGSMDNQDVHTVFMTNVLGLIAITQAVLPGMLERNKGDILMVGSIAGRQPYQGGGIYCPTKASVRSFTDVLRKELISTRIRVMEIDPGNVETEFSLVRFKGDAEKAKAVYAGAEPLVAQDIAEYAVFGLTRRENSVMAETLVFPNHQAGPFHVHKET